MDVSGFKFYDLFMTPGSWIVNGYTYCSELLVIKRLCFLFAGLLVKPVC